MAGAAMTNNKELAYLCDLDDLPLYGCRGFRDLSAFGPDGLFVARRGCAVFVYVNRCPHLGVSLDWAPDQFLDATERYIQCSTHGALFEIADGFCIAGPCLHRSLTAVPFSIVAGKLFVALPEVAREPSD
jgi:nitrite reductase/ring-hydroxylating ferredoxin subunit